MKDALEKENKKIKFLGMRVVKTVVAIYICFLINFLILSLFLIPVIYTNVTLKSAKSAISAYISCVIFLSITVRYGGDPSPMCFALNRVLIH